MVNRQLLAIVMVATALRPPAYADGGTDAFKHGAQAERKADYDAAFTYYKQAYTSTPNNAKYFAAYTRMRSDAAQRHGHAGQLLRNTGALTEALAEFQRAVSIDGSNFLAQQEVRRTADMIRRQERLKSLPKAEAAPGKAAEDIAASVELQPLPNAAITLHMTVNADAAYKTICKLAGINVVIDPDYRPQKITLDLTDVTMREALDMVRLESKTFWRPVLANTIFVAADSPAKRKEIEQNVMRTFYLRNITTPTELQEAGNVVRQVLDISRVQLLAAQDALILRGTPDQMILAEKLLADLDKPKSEVIIDVAVMQVSRNRLRTLGMNVPTSVSIGVLPSISGGASGGGAAIGFPVGNFMLSVGGGSFTALASDSNTKLLQNPQIRTLNNEKATLRIGDRVPIATGSFAGTVGGTGVSPLVSTQFQYLDVGVNIDITPHIHSDREVTLKLGLEISSVTGSESIGGITQPIIGQRRIEHETRLVDGEVNLLGGILEDTETQSMSGWPWISKLPLLKYLFAQDNKQHTENEIIFAITPHIVRAPEISEENMRQIEVGTGNAIELRRKVAAPVAPGPEHPADPAKPKQPVQAPPASAPARGLSSSSAAPQAGPQSRPAGPQ
jgi:general secretion pathway protein D